MWHWEHGKRRTMGDRKLENSISIFCELCEKLFSFLARSVFSNGITEEQSEAIVKLAYESGINLFDLSDLHSGPRAEIEMGAILKKMNWKRMTYIVTTKIYWSTK